MKKLFWLFCVVWAQKASLTGRVIDKATKEPLVGATVFIMGTYKGTYTNENGEFLISEITPGDYNIRVSLVGYTEQILGGVRLQAGTAVRLEIALSSSEMTLQTVEIIGDKPQVNLESGKSDLRLSSEDITQTTAVDVQTLASLLPGVAQTLDGLQIRGGRVYETQYIIDGVNAQDPLAGTGMGVEVSQNAIQELEVITGGVDAEYGDGTSGVIVTRIKEGGPKWKFAGRYLRDDLGFNPRTSWRTDIANIAAGGPILKKENQPYLTFFTSADMRLTDEYFGVRASQLKSSLLEKSPRDPIFSAMSKISGTSSKSEFFAPRQDNRWSMTSKIAFRPRPTTQISLSTQASLAINQNTRSLQIIGNDQIMVPGFQYFFARQPDNANTYTHRSNLTILNLTQSLGKKWNFQLTLGRLFTHLRADANGRPFRDSVIRQVYDPASIPTDPLTLYNPQDSIIYINAPEGLANNGGIATLWHDHFAREITVKAKFLYQPTSPIHFMVMGIEHREQYYQWIDVTRPWVGAPIRLETGQIYASNRIGSSNDIWRAKPATGGIFFEDRIRYKGIIASLGFRLMYWAPSRFVDDAVENPQAPILDYVREEYKKQTLPFLGRRYKFRFLPRLRVSFPVAENYVLFFNYAHATRLPHPRFVYAGLDPVYQNRSFLANLGNPNLNPEVNVGYEVGLKAQLSRRWALQLSAFYNDKFDFIVNRVITLRDQTGRFVERVFAVNLDYARVRGIDLWAQYRIASTLTAAASITYQVATGKSNSALESLLQIQQTGRNDATKEQFLAWDRPWDIKLWTIVKPDTTWLGALQGFTVYISLTYKSGLRYTPYTLTGKEPFTGRPVYEIQDDKPFSRIGSPWQWVDLRLTRGFLRGRWELFFEVRNLFNHKNAAILNPVTGRAYEPFDPVPISWRDPAYPNPLDRGIPPLNPARYLQPRQIFLGTNIRL
ncbi:MAG: TonB-dependent receptor [Bacteroidia bacterium]